MPHWKKIAGFYLIAGAGVTAWAYFKGYALSPALIVTWLPKISTIMSKPSAPAGAARVPIA